MKGAGERLTVELELPAEQQVVASRRDLHRFAEPGLCEFRTASKIVHTLDRLGFDVACGKDVMVPESRMGVPGDEVRVRAWERAVAQGADPQHEGLLAHGLTGVVGSLHGNRPGPIIALRFDIDANTPGESREPEHPPARLGFASLNEGVHHNCGHDGHTAIGLTVARRLAEEGTAFGGEVRLLFQPAEEGLRGARAMVDAGVLDGVETLLGCHIGVQAVRTGTLIAGYERLLDSVKFDARFTGRNAHAGISPERGRNALLAAAVATQNLLAISRHGAGDTRVNVGQLFGGEARNSIPAHAVLKGEVRAETSDIGACLLARAERILTSAAAMHDVEVEIAHVGRSAGADSTPELRDRLAEALSCLPGVDSVVPAAEFKASDDVAMMMRAVQDAGGQAVYMGLGADLADPHHTPRFDFDEACLDIGVRMLLAGIRTARETVP